MTDLLEKFLLFGQTVIILWSTQYGLGIPPAKLDMKKVPTLVAWTPTALFLALNAAGLSKLSFFITLIRVSSKRWQKIALWVVAIHSTILVVGTSVLGFVDCNFYRRKDPLHHDNCVPERVGKILALTVLMHGAIVVSTYIPNTRGYCMQALQQTDRKHNRNSVYPSCPPCCCGTWR